VVYAHFAGKKCGDRVYVREWATTLKGIQARHFPNFNFDCVPSLSLIFPDRFFAWIFFHGGAPSLRIFFFLPRSISPGREILSFSGPASWAISAFTFFFSKLEAGAFSFAAGLKRATVIRLAHPHRRISGTMPGSFRFFAGGVPGGAIFSAPISRQIGLGRRFSRSVFFCFLFSVSEYPAGSDESVLCPGAVGTTAKNLPTLLAPCFCRTGGVFHRDFAGRGKRVAILCKPVRPPQHPAVFIFCCCWAGGPGIGGNIAPFSASAFLEGAIVVGFNWAKMG